MSLKTKLKKHEVNIGSWITLAHPAIAEIMARAGFDWLAVDLEHSVITIREAEELIRVIGLSGVAPLVRLTSNDANQIKRVLDAGSHGVIVPLVNSKSDAIRAIESVYYPTRGKRGVGLARAQGYGSTFNDYMSWMAGEPVIIVQIEHIDALQNLEEIFSLDEIDGYIIGPYDLSASMGLPGQFDHSEVIAAIKQVHRVADEFNLAGGSHLIEPDPQQLEKLIKVDKRCFVAYSLDIRMLDKTCRDAMSLVHEGDLLKCTQLV